VVAAQEDGPGIGRTRMRRIADAAADSLKPFVQDSVEEGSVIYTDGWLGYLPLVVILQSPQGRIGSERTLREDWLGKLSFVKYPPRSSPCGRIRRRSARNVASRAREQSLPALAFAVVRIGKRISGVQPVVLALVNGIPGRFGRFASLIRIDEPVFHEAEYLIFCLLLLHFDFCH
jgi:hypothetical protein